MSERLQWTLALAVIAVFIAVIVSLFMWFKPNCPEGSAAVRKGFGAGYYCVNIVEPLP